MTTISQAIAAALHAQDPFEKISLTRAAARNWRLGRLAHAFETPMPDRPGRPAAPALLPPNRMPKRGKGGSERGRIALIHALAHIEFVAMDLALDLPGRFGGAFPRGFMDDWMKVAADEAMHFALLDRRLRQLGSFYGALPAHDGLWEAAEETAHDAQARLAVVPMVLEARGLDVTPMTIARFEQAGDQPTARILTRIMEDEIIHVSAGTKWFNWTCVNDDSEPASTWKMLIKRHFRGALKPPFNDSARSAAGLTQEYYL
ncbi:ferritin-like domain-containing protein [Sphingobium boeckii]|uniref:Uncharacterized ferritin-like protein (DUF455 family) n=1 Tax=Sphingobium boeckii TaxID=1082345 RepID=A0A7W9AGS9_9SPHN|nr:ferritin-like domain-containing protein [Sphingobium boeckii]MBB5685420.1 uncharacterized ferritin-like protein (DUF455 family) [Sphingobium boeckii]